MFFESSVTLLESLSSSGITIEGVSPLMLTIDPSLLYSSKNSGSGKKLIRIEYDFGDGTPAHIQKMFFTTKIADSSAPISEDLGDPRNYPIKHLFNIKDGNKTSINISVKCVWTQDPSLRQDNFQIYNIFLNLNTAILASNPTEISAKFFEDVHLVSTKMFGIDDSIIYNFQTFEPSYLSPVLVKWKNNNTPTLRQQLISTPRPIVKVIPAFDTQNNLEQSVNIV
jgi:hypothetical protein